MKKRILYYGIGAVVFLVIFYIALFAGTDDWKVKLPVLSYVKPFHLVDQMGDSISDKDLLGKVSVVSFFFTTCPGICPRMNTNLRTDIYDSLRSTPNFQMVSCTSDPDRDTVGRMKHYADSLGAGGNWLFLTGPKESLYRAARESFLLDDENNNRQSIDQQFIHTQLLALVDQDGRVRGIYDGLSQKELAKLGKDIHKLLE
jgi:protein SCO1/2